MGEGLICPQCQQGHVLQSCPQSLWEHVLSWIGVIPFHCQYCNHRFTARRAGKGSMESSIDRREHVRIPVRLCLSFSGGKVRGEGTVLDLSLGGCIIQSDTRVCVNDIFYLEIAVMNDDEPIEVAAMVRSVGARGIVFKFLRKAQENKRLLSFIQSHYGSASSPVTEPIELVGAVPGPSEKSTRSE